MYILDCLFKVRYLKGLKLVEGVEVVEGVEGVLSLRSRRQASYSVIPNGL